MRKVKGTSLGSLPGGYEEEELRSCHACMDSRYACYPAAERRIFAPIKCSSMRPSMTLFMYFQVPSINVM